MKKKSIAVLSSVLFLLSCSHKASDSSVSHIYASPKAPSVKIAVIPVINNTKCSLPWSLSEELSTTLCQRLTRKTNLTLYPSEKIAVAVKKLKKSNNPFSPDPSWTQSAFTGNDFVVFLELIEHEERPSSLHAPESSSAQFQMSMRLRMVALKGAEVKTVLQEMIHENHAITEPFNQYHFHQVSWDHPAFSVSPMGLAHQSLIEQIAKRIEDYVALNMP
jgi:hypothetical protein